MNNNSNSYYSKFTTSDDAHLSNVYAAYEGDDINHKRYMNIYFNLGIIEGFSGIKFAIRNSSGTSVFDIDTLDISNLPYYKNGDGYMYPVDIYTEASHRLLTDTSYFFDVIPYVKVDGVDKELKNIKDVKFNFKIPKPTITISRASDITDKTFDIRVYFKDTHNALATEANSVYEVYVQDGNQKRKIIDGIVGRIMYNTEPVDCTHSGDSCEIIVEYKADYRNNGTLTPDKKTEVINLNSSIGIGTPMIISTDSSDIIRIGFVNAYLIRRVGSVDYTIYDSDGTVLTSVTNYLPVWTSATSFDFFDIPSQLDNNYTFQPGKVYTIMMQLYSDDQLVGNISLEYVKG